MLERHAQLVADIEQHKDEVYELRSSEEADAARTRCGQPEARACPTSPRKTKQCALVEAERLAADRYQDQIDKLRDELASAQLQIDGKESELEKAGR